ncbi:MAG: hypothetical protein M3Y89_17790 [Actinomycetota bacterium]|nr:hypothetical protein [Actinomycetota bacterium]
MLAGFATSGLLSLLGVSTTPPASAAIPAATLTQGQSLASGQSLVSPDGRLSFIMQGDGNLVLYGPSGPLWSSRSQGPGASAVLQGDGNLVVYAGGVPRFASRTRGSDQLTVQSDGNVVIYGPSGPLWATNTVLAPPVTHATSGSDHLDANQILSSGQNLRSAGGQFALVVQSDGNVVLYDGGVSLFASGTSVPGDFLIMQYDGNLVVYGPNGPLWATRTSGVGAHAVLQDDGNFVVYHGTTATFATGTGQRLPGCPGISTVVYGVNPNNMVDDGGGGQLITIVDPGPKSLAGTLTAWTKSSGCWIPTSFAGQPAQPYRVETGYGGLIPIAQRQSGDGATPIGVFGFGPTMYGLSPTSPTSSYEYHQLVCGDWWDEQPGSPTYDSFQHVPCGVQPAFGNDSEALWTETVAYQHFAVLLMPPGPQVASGIFLHDDTTSGVTAGCVALPPAELDAVLGWMNKASNPHIVIGTASGISGL